MTILELLEAHKQDDSRAIDTRLYCACRKWVSESSRYGDGAEQHRAHLAEVLEAHQQGQQARAWSDGFHKGRKTENGSHVSTWPRNPYRTDQTREAP